MSQYCKVSLSSVYERLCTATKISINGFICVIAQLSQSNCGTSLEFKHYTEYT